MNETVFAKRHAIAVAQLRALEGRGKAPFYSEAIKARLGERLLASLGHHAMAAVGAGTESLPRVGVPWVDPPSGSSPQQGTAPTRPRMGWRSAGRLIMVGLGAALAVITLIVVLHPPGG